MLFPCLTQKSILASHIEKEYRIKRDNDSNRVIYLTRGLPPLLPCFAPLCCAALAQDAVPYPRSLLRHTRAAPYDTPAQSPTTEERWKQRE